MIMRRRNALEKILMRDFKDWLRERKSRFDANFVLRSNVFGAALNRKGEWHMRGCVSQISWVRFWIFTETRHSRIAAATWTSFSEAMFLEQPWTAKVSDAFHKEIHTGILRSDLKFLIRVVSHSPFVFALTLHFLALLITFWSSPSLLDLKGTYNMSVNTIGWCEPIHNGVYYSFV